MSLPNLKNLSKENLRQWEFLHAAQHEEIIAKVKSLFNYQLLSYPLYFIPGDFALWESQHQDAHNEFCSVLGIAGNDYSVLDFNDPRKLQEWIDLHLIEHRQANDILRIA